jgi:RNA polymerase sigma-70 factor (ECF subfamily)
MVQMAGSDADAEWVARARAGDPDAFRSLVERHGRALFRLAYRMTGNEQDAEDVVQESFLKAYRNLGHFEERAQFSSWLHRVAANCAYDCLRARARRQEDALEPAPDAEKPGVADRLASAEPDADRLVWSGEVRRRVRAAMGRLSAAERAAFTLRHMEGLSIDDICGALGLDESAAKQSVFRAVRKLREALAPVRETVS